MNDLLKDIKAVIFDLGNVIIDLHYDRTVESLAWITGFSKAELGEILVQAPILQQFEVGELSEEEFRERFCDLLKIRLVDSDFDELWNSFLGKIDASRIERMRQLQKQYKTYILSNTNSIHERSFNARLLVDHGIQSLDELVDRVYFSHEMGLRKPNSIIYTRLLEMEDLKPEETLFIDDRADNIESAATIGIRTYHNLQINDWLGILK